MFRILRILLAVVGTVLVLGSTVLTWVDVDIDLEAYVEISEELLEDVAEENDEASELIEDATDVVETARELLPDRLVDAAASGLNAYDLFGFGLAVSFLAIAAAVASAFWNTTGAAWLRWISLLMAILLLVSTVVVVASVFVTGSLLETFLPADWKQFSPEFALRPAPLGAVAGSALLLLSLIGKSSQKSANTPGVMWTPPAPPPQTP